MAKYPNPRGRLGATVKLGPYEPPRMESYLEPPPRRSSQLGAGTGFLLAVLALCGAGVWGVLAETWKPISVAALCAVAVLVVGLFVDVAIDRHRGVR